MFKQLLIGAFVLFSGAANASPTVMALFNTIKAAGTEVSVDHPSVCSNKQIMGMYQYRYRVIDRLTICVANHKGDNAELRDTVLHEAVHVAQTCKGGNLYTPVSIARSSSTQEIAFLSQHYSHSQLPEELEARVIAREQDEVFVTNLIKEHCK
jgi:hypothetical protein